MHAPQILRRCLSVVLGEMHAARARRLLTSVEALSHCRRLTLTDIARSWPESQHVYAPLKALDRLLSNRHLHGEIAPLYRAMTHWLIRDQRPVILVDWADLKSDGLWCVLRAAVPKRGRSLTVFERIYPLSDMNRPAAQSKFLRELARELPAGTRPILVTDAGFRSEWYRRVCAMGWDFIGRLRSNPCVRKTGESDWESCSRLHRLASSTARDLGTYQIVKQHPTTCRLVAQMRARKGRDQRTRTGKPQQGTTAKRSRKSAREPWLLATSLSKSECTAVQITTAYAKRMQIEEAFRDLKSHRYGMAFEDSLTRFAPRLAVLLLLHAMTIFTAWLVALADEAAALPDPMTRQRTHRNRYSLIRRGLEWLRRTALPPDIAHQLLVRRLPRLIERYS